MLEKKIFGKKHSFTTKKRAKYCLNPTSSLSTSWGHWRKDADTSHNELVKNQLSGPNSIYEKQELKKELGRD